MTTSGSIKARINKIALRGRQFHDDSNFLKHVHFTAKYESLHIDYDQVMHLSANLGSPASISWYDDKSATPPSKDTGLVRPN